MPVATASLTREQTQALTAYLGALRFGYWSAELSRPECGPWRPVVEALEEQFVKWGPEHMATMFAVYERDPGYGAYFTRLLGPFASEQEKDDEGPFPFIKASELVKREFRHRYLIDGLFEQEQLQLLYGPSNCGKSLLALSWACAIAAGLSWHERKTAQGPVAYVSAEGDERGFIRRLKGWSVHHQASVPDALHCCIARAPQLDNPGEVSQLTDTLRPLAPVLVVLDTLKCVSLASKENDNSEMSRVLEAAASLQRALHTALLIVHHCSKAASRDKEQDAGPVGAYTLVRRPDTVMGLRPFDDGRVEFSCFKQREAAKFPTLYFGIEHVQLGALPDDTAPVLSER